MEAQSASLLEWYDRERRVLPWREDPTPYHVWLSEIILQQTRVETGRAYYLRFIEAVPDIAALAAAREGQCLKLWEGLGYYARVRNMHRAARIIMEEYGGQMPGTAGELEKLPGIGPYSAAAIASIAFGQPVVAVDGNLLRIYARMTEYPQEVKSAAAGREARVYYGGLIPPDRPGDFNQALMDLGAGICLPHGGPACGCCPWNGLCAAYRDRLQEQYPVMPAKKARKREQRTVLLLQRGERIALRQRPEKGLLAGLYEFPGEPGILKPDQIPAVVERLGISGSEISGIPERLPPAKHIFTHIEWEMTGYRIYVRKTPADTGLIWADRRELETLYSVPSAFEVYKRVFLGGA